MCKRTRVGEEEVDKVDIFDVARSCARRWYVFIPLMLLTVFASYRAYSKVTPVYYVATTLGLANPSIGLPTQPGAETRTNGLVVAGGTQLLTNLLAMNLSGGPVAQQVAAEGGLPGYTAEVFTVPNAQLPLVVVSATDADPDAATRTVELVAQKADSVMVTLQQNAGVPDDQLLKTYPVLEPSTPVAATPSRTRSTLGLLVAGTGIAVVLTVVLDISVARLRSRRKRDDEKANDDTDAQLDAPSNAASNGKADRSSAPTAPQDVGQNP